MSLFSRSSSNQQTAISKQQSSNTSAIDFDCVGWGVSTSRCEVFGEAWVVAAGGLSVDDQAVGH